MNDIFELKRDFHTPLTYFHKGHRNYAATWARLFGVSEIEFYEHLEDGDFKSWIKKVKN